MAKRRSNQQWQVLFQKYDSNVLTQQAFCQQNDRRSHIQALDRQFNGMRISLEIIQ